MKHFLDKDACIDLAAGKEKLAKERAALSGTELPEKLIVHDSTASASSIDIIVVPSSLPSQTAKILLLEAHHHSTQEESRPSFKRCTSSNLEFGSPEAETLFSKIEVYKPFYNKDKGIDYYRVYCTDIQVLSELMKLQSTVVWWHHSYLLANTTLYNIPQINHNFIQERKQTRNLYKRKRYVHTDMYTKERTILFKRKSTRFKARAGTSTNSGRYKIIYNSKKSTTESKKASQLLFLLPTFGRIT